MLLSDVYGIARGLPLITRRATPSTFDVASCRVLTVGELARSTGRPRMRPAALRSGDQAPGESVRRLGEQQGGGAEDLRALAERALGHAHGGDRRRDRAALDRDAQRLEQ